MPSSTPLKRILQAEGRKQSWLAAEVGVDQPTLSRIVSWGTHPDASIREAIATALGRTVAEVFPPAPDREAA
jgi:transcriptional regulator with XRE-family HTH domain